MTTLSQWKKAKVHDVILPSGVEVKITLPDIPALIETGHLPQNFLDAALAAIKVAQSEEDHTPTPEELAEQRKFTNKMISMTVVDPKLREEDVEELPVQDRQMIMEFAMRQRDMDAAIRNIGGLEKYETFREVRGLPSFDPFLESLSGRGEADSEA
jgi:hypothetical protein